MHTSNHHFVVVLDSLPRPAPINIHVYACTSRICGSRQEEDEKGKRNGNGEEGNERKEKKTKGKGRGNSAFVLAGIVSAFPVEYY